MNNETEVQLNLDNAGRSRLVVSFNPLGHLADDGLTAFLGGLITEDPPDTLLFEGPFTVNYEEDLTSTQGRFGPWLERVIVDGLNAWRRTL